MTLVVPQRKELVLVSSDRVRAEILRVQQLPVLTVDAWLEDVLSVPTSTTIIVPAKAPVPRALRSPITQPGYNLGRPNKNKGKRFPATPPTPAEALRVLDITGNGKVGIRNRALMALDHCRQALEEIVAYRSGNPTPRVIAEATLAELDGDLTSFIALVNIAQRMLEMNYPADVFTGASVDAGAQFVSKLRGALDCVHGRRDV